MEAIPPRSSNARLDFDDTKTDDSRHTFTPVSDARLTIVEKDEEIKSPAEMMDFNDIDQQTADSLNPALAVMAQPLANKKYCQMCYKEFTMLMKKKHCFYCSRTVCTKCSWHQIPDGDVSKKKRSCEYCDIKIRNTQIDEFYQLGIQWRKLDCKIFEQKTDWYKRKQFDLKDDIQCTEEAKLIGKVAVDREFLEIETRKRDLTDQIKYVQEEKAKIQARLYAKILEGDEKLAKIEKLREVKAQIIMRKTRQEHLIDRTMRKKEEVMFRRQDLKDQ